jgi:hypothetical protein
MVLQAVDRLQKRAARKPRPPKPTWEALRAQIEALEAENLMLRIQLNRIRKLAKRRKP